MENFKVKSSSYKKKILKLLKIDKNKSQKDKHSSKKGKNAKSFKKYDQCSNATLSSTDTISNVYSSDNRSITSTGKKSFLKTNYERGSPICSNKSVSFESVHESKHSLKRQSTPFYQQPKKKIKRTPKKWTINFDSEDDKKSLDGNYRSCTESDNKDNIQSCVSHFSDTFSPSQSESGLFDISFDTETVSIKSPISGKLRDHKRRKAILNVDKCTVHDRTLKCQDVIEIEESDDEQNSDALLQICDVINFDYSDSIVETAEFYTTLPLALNRSETILDESFEKTTDVNEDSQYEVIETDIDIPEDSDQQNADVETASKTEILNSGFHFHYLNCGALLELQQGSKFSFYGRLSIQVLSGCVEVLGYSLQDTSPEVKVYSPKGSSFLCIETR